MAGLKPVLSTSDNWSKLYEVNKTATIINSDPPSHDPIPVFFCPLQFENPTLAIYVNTTEKKLTWKSGGKAAACVVTGILAGGDATSEIAQRWLALNEVTICRFPSIGGTYSVKFYPPYWFKNYFVEIFEYIGPGLADLEAKADAIYDAITNP